MPRLVLAKDFLSDYAKLQPPVRKAVDAAIGKFAEHTHAGLHLEKVAGARDPRVRTIRIDQSYRGVVLAPRRGEEYVLFTVQPHDDAYAYATSRRFTVNQVLGVLEERNQQALEGFTPALEQAAKASPSLLFDKVKDAELVRLGIDAEVLPVVRLLADEAHLHALANLLPRVQYDALVGLAAGLTPEQVWAEVSQHLPAAAPSQVDTEDVVAAAARTPDRFVAVSGPAELAQILAHPFDAWRVFLHPAQREIAYRDSYPGPVLVTGGAGTGKTVTALHRAVHLARRAAGPVLLTTFNRNLADTLGRQLSLLTDDSDVLGRVDVINVDRFANQVVTAALGRPVQIVDPAVLSGLWRDAAAKAGLSPVFLEREWEQVILAQGLRTPDEYVAAARHGRGTPLAGRDRLPVWEAIRQVVDQLRQLDQRTHLQVADEAARLLAERATPPYRHLIIDEGQDLHPVQWRLLRAAVPSAADDLFIASDPHQRIYDNRVSLASLGIEIRGRSRKLRINYRTTQEILDWSVRLLTGVTLAGLDDRADDLAGYRSPVHGRRPRLRGYPDRGTELAGLVEQVQSWLDADVEPHAVGVAARSGQLARQARDALTAAGVPASSTTATRSNAVRVGTMHAMKGLEFRCLAAICVDDGTVPAASAVTAVEEDPVAHGHDLLRERCLLFVACTRARDHLYVSYAGEPSPLLPY